MKALILFLLFTMSLPALSQENHFTLQAKIIDSEGNPISDVYIVNLNSNEKDISLNNGVFTINASASDSLVLSHISYFRKTVTIHSILLNPIITLYSEEIEIKEVTINPSQKTEQEMAAQNIEQIQYEHRPIAESYATESERVRYMATAENRVERTAASMVNIATFSISESMDRLFTKLKKTDYSSTKKQLQAAEEKK